MKAVWVYVSTVIEQNTALITVSFNFNRELWNLLWEKDSFYYNRDKRRFETPYSPAKLDKVKALFKNISWVILKYSISPKTAFWVRELKPVVKQAIALTEQYMQQMRYSENTINLYIGALKVFFKFHQDKLPAEIKKRHLQLYNVNYILKYKYSSNYQNLVVSALKVLLKSSDLPQIDELDLERPIKNKKLPVVLSLEEISRIIKVTSNYKHRVLLSTVYSCGMRIGEALNLRLNDLHLDNMLIHIKSAKGKKDRVVGLSPALLAELKQYFKVYQPKKFVFEGNNGNRYSQSSCRAIFKRSVELAGIKKRVTLHSLRHSFATHLLENGTDLRYIQQILGHSSPKTTMIYTHVSKKDISRIINPFDNLEL